jgi:hypothetical protein
LHDGSKRNERKRIISLKAGMKLIRIRRWLEREIYPVAGSIPDGVTGIFH